jgi:hypothetical protein
MVSIIPKGTFSAFTTIVFLRRSAGNELQAIDNFTLPPVPDQQVNMI